MDGLGDPTKLMFSIAMYGDGTVAINGKEPRDGKAGLARVLRIIADAIENDELKLREYYPR